MRYQAFMSYTHRADARIAEQLRQRLHRFANPLFSIRAVNIFMDNATMSANARLWSTIEAALAESQYFILIASPESANSNGVRREVEHWLAHRPVEAMLFVVTRGEIVWNSATVDFDWERTSALPTVLRGRLEEEPRWVDLRWTRDSTVKAGRDPRFTDAVADLAAPLRGRPKDALIGEDVTRHRRRVALAWVTSLALVTLTGAAIWIALIARGERAEAERQRESAEERERLAVSRELAATGRSLADADHDLAVLLAIEGMRRAPTAEAHAALVSLLRASPVRATLRREGFGDARTPLSPATGFLVTIGPDEIATVRDSATGRLRVRLTRAGRVRSASFDDGGHRVLALGRDEAVRIADAERDVEPLVVRPPLPDGFRDAAWRPDGAAVITLGRSGRLQLWSARTGAPLQTLSERAGRLSMAPVDGSGRWIAAIRGRQAWIWDAQTGRVRTRLQIPGQRICAVALSPVEPFAATLTSSQRTDIWDVRSGSRLRTTGDHVRGSRGHCIGYLNDVRFSSDGRFVTSMSGGRRWEWRAAGGGPIFDPLGQTLAISEDGRRAVDESAVVEWASGRQLVDFSRALSPEESGNQLFSAALDRHGYVAATSWIQLPGDPVEDMVRIFAVGRRPIFTEAQGHRVDPDPDPLRTVETAAVSPDGRLVATAGADGTAKLWNARTGACLRTFGRVNWDGLFAASFSTDGRLLATGSLYGRISMWDARSGRLVRTLQRRGHLVTATTFSPDRRLVAASSQRGRVSVWDARTGEIRHVVLGLREHVGALAFSPDSRALVATVDDGRTRVWSTRSGRQLDAVPTATSYAADFSADSRLVAALRSSGPVAVRDVRRRITRILHGHTAEVLDYNFSEHGRRLVTASRDGTARVWDLAAGRDVAVLRGHRGSVFQARFGADDRRVVTASADGTAAVWDASSARQLAVLHVPGARIWDVFTAPRASTVATLQEDGLVTTWDAESGARLAALGGHGADVETMTYSADGSVLLTRASDGTIRVRDAHTGRGLAFWHGPAEGFRKLVLSQDGTVLMIVEDRREVTLWAATTGARLRVLRGHRGAVNDAAFSRDGQLAITASDDGTARLWDTASGRARGVLAVPGSRSPIQYAAVSPDGSMAATAAEDGVARLWSVRSRAALTELDPPAPEPPRPGIPVHVAFTPDGRSVVTAGPGRSPAAVWSVGSWRRVRSFPQISGASTLAMTRDGEHLFFSDDSGLLWDAREDRQTVMPGREAANESAFSADGQHLLLRGERAILVWSLRARQVVGSFPGATGALSPDGRSVASADHDGHVQVFRCELCQSPGALMALGRRKVGRDLTAEERRQYLGGRDG